MKKSHTGWWKPNPREDYVNASNRLKTRLKREKKEREEAELNKEKK